MVDGKLQREGDVIHVVVSKCHNFSRLLRDLTPRQDHELPVLFSRADEKTFTPDSRSKPPPGEEHFPGARDFR
jgi:error-prone DNA polymerase